ncbi:MAG: protein kinase [Cyanobacteria bacterium CRU_2_1]|nr:protein kinase [Cyanobacteria bacterium CRU_2_1]
MTPEVLNNRYRVVRVLASGGFGETFLAEDTFLPSKRLCVLKQLRLMTNNAQVYQIVQERFQREAAILEELGRSSSQIPELYAYFEEGGRFYLVQEWIEGHTLADIVHIEGAFSEEEVRELLEKTLTVLDYIHARRIIHRDIKPDNIIIRHGDAKPVLIDFGAVKETVGTVLNSQGHTVSSIVIGTPGYMPPEQAAGRPVFSSDLYSLGLTAIYLLTGKKPQDLEVDPITGDLLWRSLVPQVSYSLAEILDKVIQYHPRDRFPVAQDLLNVLQSNLPFSTSIPSIPPTQTIPASASDPSRHPSLPPQSPSFPSTPPVIPTPLPAAPAQPPTPLPASASSPSLTSPAQLPTPLPYIPPTLPTPLPTPVLSPSARTPASTPFTPAASSGIPATITASPFSPVPAVVPHTRVSTTAPPPARLPSSPQRVHFWVAGGLVATLVRPPREAMRSSTIICLVKPQKKV